MKPASNIGRMLVLGLVLAWVMAAPAHPATAPCVALPPASDVQGCTSAAMAGRKNAPAFSTLPPSMAVGCTRKGYAVDCKALKHQQPRSQSAAMPSPAPTALAHPCTAPVAAHETITLNLDAAEQLALQRHPLLSQSQAEVETSRARALSAGQLPDPQVRFGIQNAPIDSLALNRSEMSMVTLGVTQMFAPPGKRGLVQQSAEQETLSAHAKHRDSQARIRHEVHMAWLDLYYQERELAVVCASYELFDQIVQAAHAQYRSGLVQEADVLKAQLERDDLREREESIQAARSLAQSRLARLIGMPAANVAVTAELPAPPTVHTDEELMQTLPQHPQVAALDAQIRSAELELAAARRDYYPEFGVEAMYGYRATRDMGGAKVPDMLSASVVMSLPLWTAQRQDARAQERQAQWLALRYQRDDVLLQLHQEARTRYAGYTRLQSRLALLERTLLPQAEQTVSALLAAYRTGRTDMASVLRARQASLDYALRSWRLRIDLWIATAELNYLGTTVTETSDHEH